MEKSLKQIIYETNVLVDAHVQLRSFYYGDLLDIIKIGAIDYATCFLSINSASNNANFETFNLELFVFDILASDDSNRTDIENTTKRILNDLITTIRYSTRWNDFSEVLNDVSELKYYDKLQDRLSGWGCTIQLKVYSNDCLLGLPIDGYDFDMAGNFELTVLAIVKNTNNDILATKLVSDSDDTIIVPNITVTDSDGSTYSQPSGVNVVCTAGGGSGDVEINGTNIGTYTAPNTFAANVTLDGNASGTWNSGTQTWEVVSNPCADATYQIEDTNDNILYSGSIVSGGNLDQVIQNSTVTITDDSSNTLYTVSTLAEGSDTQVIQDSTAVLKNTDNTILSTTSINAEASADIIAPDSTVENSDASYTDTIPCGDTLVLPDETINITDQLGNVLDTITFPVYSTVNIDIDSYIPPCADATYDLEDSLGGALSSGSIPSGTNDVIVAPDGDVENSDASYTDTVTSGGTLVLPDSNVNVNSNLEGTVVSVKTIDIDVTDGTNPVTPTSIGIVGNTVTIEVPAAGGAPVGAKLMKTGQTTSYRTGDNGDLQEGRAVDFFTLASNNPFGNTDRFTDELGGQTYANDIVIDWSTYDGGTVLGYYRVRNGVNVLWNQAIDDSLLVSIGIFTTGWRLPNIYELQNICNFSVPTSLNYAPFTLGLSGSVTIWSSTTNPAATTQAYRLANANVLGIGNKTGGANYIPCRTFTVTGTILT